MSPLAVICANADTYSHHLPCVGESELTAMEEEEEVMLQIEANTETQDGSEQPLLQQEETASSCRETSDGELVSSCREISDEKLASSCREISDGELASSCRETSDGELASSCREISDGDEVMPCTHSILHS